MTSLLILAFPLIGFLLLNGFGRFFSKRVSGFLASVTVLGSFIVSILMLRDVFLAGAIRVPLFTWFHVGQTTVSFALLLDSLSLLMCLMITGVGFLIHVYSIGYMHEEEGFTRYFSHLNLFIFFMLFLVLSDSFLGMFVGWEGVGLCSYLLIGFWFQTTAFGQAAKKAFLMNRVGDLGFILGILAMIIAFGSTQFSVVFSGASHLPIGSGIITVIALLLFVGATGKSAQIPLFTWLPDAMAGPTPVSALIHAATMVTAGVYMVARSHVFYMSSPIASTVVLWVGLSTALLGAIIATRQSDIKKILAYSTMSQLGLMVSALGLGAYSAALFHMLTHAFFKALLFLAAGSVIHALHGEQNVFKMGGLRKSLPFTFGVFLIGALALAGFPPFSGFFSKDMILLAALEHSPLVFALLVFVSILTAYYVCRLVVLVFMGTARSDKTAHESSWIMQIPLGILAIFAAASGFLHLPETLDIKLVVGTVVIIGLMIAWCYRRFSQVQVSDEKSSLISNKFYIDEMYNGLIIRPILLLARFFSTIFDPVILELPATILGKSVMFSGRRLKQIQNGHIGFYLLVMTAAIAVILVQLLWI